MPGGRRKIRRSGGWRDPILSEGPPRCDPRTSILAAALRSPRAPIPSEAARSSTCHSCETNPRSGGLLRRAPALEPPRFLRNEPDDPGPRLRRNEPDGPPRLSATRYQYRSYASPQTHRLLRPGGAWDNGQRAVLAGTSPMVGRGGPRWGAPGPVTGAPSGAKSSWRRVAGHSGGGNEGSPSNGRRRENLIRDLGLQRRTMLEWGVPEGEIDMGIIRQLLLRSSTRSPRARWSSVRPAWSRNCWRTPSTPGRHASRCRSSAAART